LKHQAAPAWPAVTSTPAALGRWAATWYRCRVEGEGASRFNWVFVFRGGGKKGVLVEGGSKVSVNKWSQSTRSD